MNRLDRARRRRIALVLVAVAVFLMLAAEPAPAARRRPALGLAARRCRRRRCSASAPRYEVGAAGRTHSGVDLAAAAGRRGARSCGRARSRSPAACPRRRAGLVTAVTLETAGGERVTLMPLDPACPSARASDLAPGDVDRPGGRRGRPLERRRRHLHVGVRAGSLYVDPLSPHAPAVGRTGPRDARDGAEPGPPRPRRPPAPSAQRRADRCPAATRPRTRAGRADDLQAAALPRTAAEPARGPVVRARRPRAGGGRGCGGGRRRGVAAPRASRPAARLDRRPPPESTASRPACRGAERRSPSWLPALSLARSRCRPSALATGCSRRSVSYLLATIAASGLIAWAVRRQAAGRCRARARHGAGSRELSRPAGLEGVVSGPGCACEDARSGDKLPCPSCSGQRLHRSRGRSVQRR